MDQRKAIDELRDSVKEVWEGTRKRISPNISRGHSRSISTDVEDKIALFVLEVLEERIPGVRLYLDPTIRVNGKTYRPDLLVVDDVGVIAMMEIKANMGYCRVAKGVLNKLKEKHEVFSAAKTIECGCSIEGETKTVVYCDDVKLFLITLTSGNVGSKKNIDDNKAYAEEKGVSHYLLFDGWYGDLLERDIKGFIGELQNL